MSRYSSLKARANEELLYSQVAEEIEKNEINKGLWAKALSESGNIDSSAKALYIKLRVQSLKDEIEFLHESERGKISRKNLDNIAKVIFWSITIFLTIYVVLASLLSLS